jgi:DNA-binding NtrC family response regulator
VFDPDWSSKPTSTANIILIVDDDAGVAAALHLLFELHGLIAEVARTPREAMERVKRGGVRVVIHDMNFTRGETRGDEGLALFRDLRRDARGISVILLTAWPSPATGASVLQEGAAAYLMKPWDDERLVAMIHGLLGIPRPP